MRKSINYVVVVALVGALCRAYVALSDPATGADTRADAVGSVVDAVSAVRDELQRADVDAGS